MERGGAGEKHAGAPELQGRQLGCSVFGFPEGKFDLKLPRLTQQMAKGNPDSYNNSKCIVQMRKRKER
jgi:hypothetical protein